MKVLARLRHAPVTLTVLSGITRVYFALVAFGTHGLRHQLGTSSSTPGDGHHLPATLT